MTRTDVRGVDSIRESLKDRKGAKVEEKEWKVKNGTAVVAHKGGRDRREREEQYRIDGRLRTFQGCMKNENNLTVFSSSTSFTASSSSSSSSSSFLGSHASHSTASSSSSRDGNKEESAMVRWT